MASTRRFERNFGGTGDDWANSVQQTADGGYILAGSTYSFGNASQAYLIKTDERGFLEPPPATDWYLAEGCTRFGMETYICVQNPNDYGVTVDLTFMTEEGERNVPSWEAAWIEPLSRANFPLHTQLSYERISTHVHASGPVVCERAMYGAGRAWAHNSAGFSP